jgi:hypothetical protein
LLGAQELPLDILSLNRRARKKGLTTEDTEDTEEKEATTKAPINMLWKLAQNE